MFWKPILIQAQMNNEEDWRLLQRNTAGYWGRKQNGRFGKVVTFCAIFVYFISIPRSNIVSIRNL